MLIHNLLRTQACLGPALDAAFQGEGERLTSAQFNALLALRAGGAQGLRMGEIGARLVVTKSNVTRLVDRLEARGLAVRGDDGDRRATVVRLTSAGEAALDALMPQYATAAARVIDCLDAGEKQTLVRLLRKLRHELRARGKEGA